MSWGQADVSARVVARTATAASVDLFDLVSETGTLPGFSPGSHIDVILPTGDVRQYSLLPSPAGTWRIGVLREPAGRGGSLWLHDVLAVGEVVRVRGPQSHFAFRPEAGGHYLFLAAGIGITPMVAMIDAAIAAGVDWELHYSGRARAGMALVEELESAHPDRVAVYETDAGTRADLASIVAAAPGSAELYCCGPQGYLDAVEAAAGGRTVHVERFTPKQLGDVVNEEFEVELELSGQTLTIPADRSILEVVEEAGVFVLSSCREGTCGTCETPVVDGEIGHRDSILTPGEQALNDTIYICVSRAAGGCPRLVLEL